MFCGVCAHYYCNNLRECKGYCDLTTKEHRAADSCDCRALLRMQKLVYATRFDRDIVLSEYDKGRYDYIINELESIIETLKGETNENNV